jgi:3-methyladenine DNA glycosylase AlkD
MPRSTSKRTAPPKQRRAKKTGSARPPTIAQRAESALAALKRFGNKKTRDEMSSRYGIHLPNPKKAFGVPVGKIQQVGKTLGRSHKLAAALWKTGWYEARMLAAFVDDPKHVTPAQMDRWCRGFDNWGIVDTVCFKLFDQVSPKLAFRKVEEWSRQKGEFQKRAAFALLACLALHDKRPPSPEVNKPFAESLLLIEREAGDERNFVKKSVSWALRAIARRGDELRSAALWSAQQLAASPEPAARWVGKDALRDITKPA